MQSVPSEILNERYKCVKQIGNGAYAIVWEAVNIKNQQRVAIKQLVNLRDELTIKRSLREILLLKHFNNHPNIVHIFDVFVKSRKMEEVFVVCELMETDLHSLIQSSKSLHADWYKLYTYQILCGLKCIHSAGVLHRDLKPKNILINKDGELKICDFGMGKAATTTLKMTLLEQVATPYYRAPEGLLLKDQQYTEAVDVWATGCILGELILKRPLFPGKNNQELLDCIVEVLGTPSQEDLDAFPESGYKDYLKSMPKKEKKDFSALFFGIDPLTIELLEKMLVFNYNKRITVEQALEHPYFTELHDEDEEPVAESKFQELELRLSKQQMHDRIMDEVKHYQRLHWEEDAESEQQPVQQTAPSEEPALTVGN
jgi:serine/threonine protein kinase